MRNSRLENEILRRVDELVQCAMSVSLKDEPGREEQLARGIALVQEMGDFLLEVLEGREQHLQALLEQLIAQRLPDRRILHSFGNFPHDIQYIISEGTANYLKTLKQGEKAPEDHSGKVSTSSGVPAPTVYDNNFSDEDEGPELVAASDTLHETAPEYAVTSPIDNHQFSSLDETAGESKIAATHPEVPSDFNATQKPVADACPGRTAIPETTTIEGIYPGLPDNATRIYRDNMEIIRLALLQTYPGEEIINNYPTPYGKLSFYLPRLQLGFEPASLRHDWRYNFYCRQHGIRIRVITEEELVNPIFLARRLRREAYLRQLS